MDLIVILCSLSLCCWPAGNKSKHGSSAASSEKQHSYSWYRNASESDKKPMALTTTLKTESKGDSSSSYDAWDAIMGLPSPSQSQAPRNPPSTQWASSVRGTSGYVLGRSGAAGLGLAEGRTREEEKVPSPPRPQTPGESEEFGSDWDIPVEPSLDQSQTSSSSLLRSTNCRTYRRPNKQGAGKSSDSGCVPGAGPPKNSSDTSNKPSSSGRGRSRDFTVLHPSCLSVCNVTIQERGVEDFTSGGPPSSGGGVVGGGGSSGVSCLGLATSGSAVELAEAGWQRKKSEAEVTKPRYSKHQHVTQAHSGIFDFGLNGWFIPSLISYNHS